MATTETDRSIEETVPDSRATGRQEEPVDAGPLDCTCEGGIVRLPVDAVDPEEPSER